jgi:hypothetical protein
MRRPADQRSVTRILSAQQAGEAAVPIMIGEMD